MKRNGSGRGGNKPWIAEEGAWARRWRWSRLERDEGLREKVLSGLRQGWSPEEVAGRLKLEAGRTVISHESIYRFVYGQMGERRSIRGVTI